MKGTQSLVEIHTKREIELIRGEPISVPLYLPQIPHGQAWDRARYYGKLSSPFILVINQPDAQNFCFTISLFHASACFEHMCPSSGGQNCITQPLVSSYL